MGEQTKLVRKWRREGWTVEPTNGGHLRLTHPFASRPIITSNTPSDPATMRNREADMRRALRDRTPPPEPADEPAAPLEPPTAPDAPQPDLQNRLAHERNLRLRAERLLADAERLTLRLQEELAAARAEAATERERVEKERSAHSAARAAYDSLQRRRSEEIAQRERAETEADEARRTVRELRAKLVAPATVKAWAMRPWDYDVRVAAAFQAAPPVVTASPGVSLLRRQLREHRVALGMSLAQAAERIGGVNGGTVRGWEGGAPIPDSRLRDVAAFLALPLPTAAAQEWLAAAIRAARMKRHMMQKQLAEAVGVHQVAVSRWEAGERVAAKYLPRLRAVLGDLPDQEAPPSAPPGPSTPKPAPPRPYTPKPAPSGRPAAIQAMRLERGLTQTQLAEMIGVNEALVSRWESGKQAVPDKRWAQLHAALNVSLPPPQGQGEALAALRAQRGLTRAALGSAVGLTDSAIYQYENSKCSISPRRRAALEAALGARLPDPGPPPPPSPIAVKDGKVIHAARSLSGYSQKAIAAKLGISQKSVSRYENGAFPVPPALRPAFERALGVSLE